MKIILCTGDSHTCGQGADSIKSASKPKNPNRRYNTDGKGIGETNMIMQYPSYVNLLRQYVAENTGSKFAYIEAKELCETYGYGQEGACCLLDKELVIDNHWDLILLCVGEREEAARIQIYLDGQLCKEETLHTSAPRYNDYSYRYIPIWCEGVREVKVKPVSGTPRIRQIQYAAGKYAVVNSGVGSCTTQRYFQQCLPYGVEAFEPAIIVAEGQTINDWIHYTSAQEHYDRLKDMMEAFRTMGAKLLFTTVSPIQNKQENAAGVRYSDFIEASRKMAKDLRIPIADAHEAFEKALEDMSAEEQFEYMYVDRWHVNGKGHKIYADTIFAKLKEML